VLEPIDVHGGGGVKGIDARVRRVMQVALSRLAAQRRLPVLG
jgi:hypothetical protein